MWLIDLVFGQLLYLCSVPLFPAAPLLAVGPLSRPSSPAVASCLLLYRSSLFSLVVARLSWSNGAGKTAGNEERGRGVRSERCLSCNAKAVTTSARGGNRDRHHQFRAAALGHHKSVGATQESGLRATPRPSLVERMSGASLLARMLRASVFESSPCSSVFQRMQGAPLAAGNVVLLPASSKHAHQQSRSTWPVL